METKIVFVINKRIINGKLTKFFTGCYCYHIGILINGKFYDVSPFKGRRVQDYKPENYKDDYHIIFDSPVEISEAELIHKMEEHNKPYGFIDYIMFLFRPLNRIFPNFKMFNPYGVICSEQVNQDLYDAGWYGTPWNVKYHPPSPCEMLDYFLNKYKQN